MKNFYMQISIHKVGQFCYHPIVKPQHLLLERDEKSTTTNIFLNQNIGKGPPGRARSPGNSLSSSPNSISLYYKFQSIIKNKNQLHTIKNFTIMKKQILFLVLFVMASFAGLTEAYGQAVHNSAPKDAVTCTNDALHPIAGKPYEYVVDGAPSGGNYTWWATTNASFITAGVLQNTAANVLVSPDVVPTTASQYNSGTNTSGTIELTWGTDILAAAMGGTGVPTFVSVYYTGTTCADNLKVFQVEPVNAFMVDITNVENSALTSLAYGATEDQCYDKVQSASWSGNAMTYDYGTNILYFEVVASNFSGTWTPTFTLTGLQGTQTAVIEWDYSTAFTSPVAVTSGAASGTDVTTSLANTSNGVSIYARVTITNSTYEGLTNDAIALAVTGTNSASQRDVMADDCNTPATLASNTATQTLNLRPTVTETTEVGTFE